MIRAGATSQGWAEGPARALCISLSPSVSGEGSARARETDVESMATDRGELCRELSRFLPRFCQMPRVPEGLLAVGSLLDSQYGSFLVSHLELRFLDYPGGPVRPRFRSYSPVSRTVGIDLRLPKASRIL